MSTFATFVLIYFLIGVAISAWSVYIHLKDHGSPTDSKFIDFLSFIPVWPLVLAMLVDDYFNK
jgi:hypothetical protein